MSRTMKQAASLTAKRERSAFVALLLGAGFLCTGCQSVPQKVVVDFVEPKVALPTPASVAGRPANGSLFNPSNYRPAFEDPRARNVGDIVTIMIVENVTASQKPKSMLRNIPVRVCQYRITFVYAKYSRFLLTG